MPTNERHFQELCDSIFALSPGLRFVGVIDRMGRLVAGGMRKGVRSLELDSEKLYLEFALRSEMRKEFDAEFGKTIFSFTEREKLKLASFPLNGSYILRVSMETKESHSEIIEKTLEIINNTRG
ncbi:MAG TPA: DUF6659 family protein [Nitrososphaeraceae archaeon]|nr:DUF6659 family protein [Nitrososphaeraceae archaeon]